MSNKPLRQLAIAFITGNPTWLFLLSKYLPKPDIFLQNTVALETEVQFWLAHFIFWLGQLAHLVMSVYFSWHLWSGNTNTKS